MSDVPFLEGAIMIKCNRFLALTTELVRLIVTDEKECTMRLAR